MKRAALQLYERYRLHHDMGSPFLEWIGVVGTVAFPLFYLLRRSASMPALYDDFQLRVIASVLCLFLAMRRSWPRNLAPFYLPYSYFTVFYCLSFLLSFTMLKNGGGVPSVVNMVMGAILITLLTDWRNTVAILLAGYVTSIAAFFATSEGATIPAAFIISAAGTMLVVVAGALSHTAQKRVELERMRRLYSGLAGSIAHELRMPLMQARQSLDRIEEVLGSKDVSSAGEAIAQGRSAVDRGFQAIALTLEQLHARSLDPAGFAIVSVAHCVRKAVAGYAFETPAQRDLVTIDEAGDFFIRVDEATFTLLIYNLLKNALYYVPAKPGMHVTVRIGGGTVVVHDSGPGIPAACMGKLFREFESVGKSGGTGLGLAFCRRAMRAFGGDITCQSEEGRYTAFTLTFPAASIGQAQAAHAARPETALDGLTVLVVDDSNFNRSVARARLSAFGIRMLEASHGGEALRLVDEGARPAAILMDLEMPVMGGIETTQRLRQRPSPLRDISVLGMSANDLGANRDAALAAGMNGFLAKPVDPDVLRAELARVLCGTQAGAAAMPTSPA